jgi:hypothetical protein
MEKRQSKRSRSRSSSHSASSGGSSKFKKRLIGRKAKTGFSSNFTEQAPTQEAKPAQTTAEILSSYKTAQQPLQSHNKSERQLYIGNIPQNYST